MSFYLYTDPSKDLLLTNYFFFDTIQSIIAVGSKHSTKSVLVSYMVP